MKYDVVVKRFIYNFCRIYTYIHSSISYQRYRSYFYCQVQAPTNVDEILIDINLLKKYIIIHKRKTYFFFFLTDIKYNVLFLSSETIEPRDIEQRTVSFHACSSKTTIRTRVLISVNSALIRLNPVAAR